MVSCTIKSLQSDGAKEFLSARFQNQLSSCGIFHQISCPHTPKQNGASERKHRHIVDMGLTLMANSSTPPEYWVEAFNTALYLINRLPTKILNFVSPYEKLFKRAPEYSILWNFGCACFPYLRPYNKNKLEFRSKKCVFIGYSLHHQGYRCLDPITSRVYLSHHVIFNETEFPFSTGSILTLPPIGADPISFPPPSFSPPIPMLPSLPPSPLPVPPIPHIPHLPISDSVSNPTASIQQQSTPLNSATSKPVEPEIRERSIHIYCPLTTTTKSYYGHSST